MHIIKIHLAYFFYVSYDHQKILTDLGGLHYIATGHCWSR